jgi:prepilin-type N-terminal cleavage/methylation domain-containing protein
MKNSNGFSLLELLIVVAIILIIATIAIPSLLRSRQAANEAAAVATLKTINTAQITYTSTAGSYGTLDDLIKDKLLDDAFTGIKAGYRYTVEASAADYTAEAIPSSTNSGRFGYYSHPDAVIRYSMNASLAPAGESGRAVK